MYRKWKKNHPNDIIATAIYMGLVALVRLSSKRSSEKTRKHYISIKNMWQKWREQIERTIIDFHPVEPNMRNQFLGIVWTSTRRYGNREFKRVYNWLEGTVGPLNALLNYAGARLRDLAMTRYPFPEPESFQIRKYADGSKKILSKKEADLLGPDDAVKTYWRGGYRRRGKSPLILLAHPTLPELDFVDMIRAHMVELCRQCFIHNVPRTDAHKYINLLIHRLQPFLDWVYTDGEQGRPYFNRHSDHELRNIVLEIRALHGKRTGREKSVTKGLDDTDTSILTIESFRSKVEELRNSAKDKKAVDVYSQILNYIDEGDIEQRDIEKGIEQVLALSSREGSEWHRILLSDLHHPKSLKQVVFAGDTMLEELSSILIIGELPVSRRKGQVDLVIFIRREVSGRIIWTPVLILEVKTKMSFDYNLYGLRSKNKSVEDYAPTLYVWKHAKSDDEWKEIFSSKPHPRTLKQLNAYELEILSEYQQVASFDPTPPESLWKGVIVLDTDQNPLEVFDAFNDLLDDLVMRITSGLLDFSKTTAYSLKTKSSMKTPRVATILTPGEGPVGLLNEMCVPESLPVDDPFSERIIDDRLLTLYVPVSSPTSSGNSASWISRNWHLLNHIQECTSSTKDTEIHWIDLMGDYPSEQLMKKRFGLDQYLKGGWINKKQHTTLDTLLNRIRFIDLRANIDQVLAGNGLGFQNLIDNLTLSLQEKSASEKIIIIDGWSEFKEIVPSSRQYLIHTLEKRLLSSLPTSNVNIIWIDSGVQHTRMNMHYQRKCISPLPYDSPRKMHVDEILYNLPTSSRSFGRFLPKRDDERYIVQDVPASVPPWRTKIQVPQLIDYSKKFRGGQRRKPILTEEEVYEKSFKPMYGRGVKLSNIYSDTSHYSKRQVSELEGYALSLAPSTHRPREAPTEDQEQESKPDSSLNQLVIPTLVTEKSSTLSSRLTYSPEAPIPRPNRSQREYVSSEDITRRWYYERVPSQDFSEDNEEYKVMRPPTIRITTSNNIDSKRTRGMEVRRLLYTVQFLNREKAISKNLRTCCKKITTICTEVLSTEHNEQDLLYALERVRNTILEDTKRVRMWETVRPIRQGLFELLNSENRVVLGEVLKKSPEVLLLYGNNLFLTIVAVLDCGYKEILHAHVVPLWQSVVEWELYQLGFKAEQGSVNSKYDIHSIYSNLMNRVKTFPKLNLPEQVLSKQQTGQIIWVEDEGGCSAWIIFQSEKGMVAGLVDTLQSQWLRPSWHRCVSDSQTRKDKAEQALYSHSRNTIVVTEVRNNKILWMLTEGEDGPVWLPYVFEHGTPQKEGQSIPWIRLMETFEVLSLYGEVLVLPLLPIDTEKHVNDFLKEITSLEYTVTQVTCEVDINTKNGVYELKFKDTSINTSLGTLQFKDTAELVKTLRHPIRKGTPLRMKNRSLVTWDHRTDVNYLDVDVKIGTETDIIHLSLLKPLVHRSRFYPDEFKVPKTCGELLSTEAGSPLILRIQSEDSTFKRLRVEFDELPTTSSLHALENVTLNIFDLALLAECEELIDTSTNKRHQVQIDAKELFDLRFSGLSDYPRLQSAIASLDVSDYDWTRQSWTISLNTHHQVKNEIIWYIESTSSGKVWQNMTFTFVMDYTLNIDDVLSNFEDEVSHTVPLKHLSRFSDTTGLLKRTLRSRGWRKGKPRCRLDLEVRKGQYVAVVSRIESGGGMTEISTFPVDVMKDSDTLYDELESEYGMLTPFEIVNSDEFYGSVRLSSSETEVDVDELDEKVEYLKQIKELEADPTKNFQLGYRYVKLAKCRSDSDLAIKDITKALELLEGCDHSDSGVVLWQVDALITRCELSVLRNGDNSKAKELGEWAKEMQDMYTQLLQMNAFGKDYPELRVRIQQLQEKIEL